MTRVECERQAEFEEKLFLPQALAERLPACSFTLGKPPSTETHAWASFHSSLGDGGLTKLP